MQASAIAAEPRKNAQVLLGKAVHRNRRFSIEGTLERVFTLAFNGLVYPQIWEDPVVDMAAMEIAPHHHVVAISSGGCNVLSYLTENPARITAVDLSPAHVALVKLKIAGLKRLSDWRTFYRFFGEARSRQNIADYFTYLRDDLDDDTTAYWEKRFLTGRRRISRFASNIYRKGMLGRFIGAGHLAARLGGCKLTDFTRCQTQAEQQAYFNREIAPLFEARLVRWLTSHRASLFGLGIPPAQFEALSGGKPMADVLKQRLERLACGFPLQDNYFAWQAFGRTYAPDALGSLPPYLQEKQFEMLKARAGRVTMLHASLTDVLDKMAPGTAHRFVLLDAQDWMTDAQLNALWQAITRAAAPGARVIFRTAGEDTLLPGRVKDTTLSCWSYLESLSRRLGAQDRSSIYGGFHVYQFNG